MSDASAAILPLLIPSISTASWLSRNPAVSDINTGKPQRSSCTSRTSLVVPDLSWTIATSLLANQFSKLDFPTFGAPTMATLMPSRNRWPLFSSSRCVDISFANRATSALRASDNPTGSSSSEKSRTASMWARFLNSRHLHSSYTSLRLPWSCLIAWIRCISVSAAIRSANPSASVRSIFSLIKARRENSPGSATRTPLIALSSSITAETTALPPCRWYSTTSSPVKLCGSGNQITNAISSSIPVLGRNILVSVAWRGLSWLWSVSFSIVVFALGPDTLMRATPAVPGPLAKA